MLRVPLAATGFIARRWSRRGGSRPSSAAERKLAAIGPLGADRGRLRITLDFAPERFHQLRLQEAGRLVEVRDRTVYMMDVAPAALRTIAGEYWVDEIARGTENERSRSTLPAPPPRRLIGRRGAAR